MKNSLQKNASFLILFSILISLNSCGFLRSLWTSDTPKKTPPSWGKSPKKGNPQVVKGVFDWPLKGDVSSKFGARDGREHEGIDIRAEKGSPIRASASGQVIYSGEFSGYGNLILIEHAKNYVTAYAHNDKNRVKQGEKVKKGQKIGEVGKTGNASGYHLHFEIRQFSTPADPLKFLPKF